MHLDIAISHKRHVTYKAFVLVQRWKFTWVFITEAKYISVEPVHCRNIGRTEVDVMQFQFHSSRLAECLLRYKGYAMPKEQVKSAFTWQVTPDTP